MVINFLEEFIYIHAKSMLDKSHMYNNYQETEIKSMVNICAKH